MSAKIKLLLLAILFCSGKMYSQNGLENLIVETYYISDANDTNANLDGGVLPVGSVTYRLYADMLPGYKFQAAYGVNTPGAAHVCFLSTSTLFWNNGDRGATAPTFTKVNAVKNTVMLDSWLSVGAACAGNFGILKSEDDGVANAVNNYTPQVLQDTNPLAGIPLITQDGFMAVTGVNPESVTEVGINSSMFDDQTIDSLFWTDNGSWASLNGSIGPDPAINKVLIGQFTTDGIFCFQLNIQIGTPTGGVENYVAINPVGNEILFPALNWCSNLSQGITDHAAYDNAMLMIYPNPVNDVLKVKIIPAKQSKENSYTITDIAGKVLLHKNLGTGSTNYFDSVDMSSFSKGIYFIQLNSGGMVSTKKIIKS